MGKREGVMAVNVGPDPFGSQGPELNPDFVDRLASSLDKADRYRRRHLLVKRGRSVLLAILLLGPLVAWHLTYTSPQGAHVVVDVLAWLALFLDVGVHLDTSLLAFLGLQALPAVVGVLLFLLVTVTLLWQEQPKS